MKRRILLVDDEVAVLLTLKAVLEISGFDVDTAASAREGKLKLRSNEYHMIISDMRMESDRAGEAILEAARRAVYRPAIALLSAYPLAEEDWQEMGADRMLVKPMHTRMLLEQIEGLLSAHNHELSGGVSPLRAMASVASPARTKNAQVKRAAKKARLKSSAKKADSRVTAKKPVKRVSVKNAVLKAASKRTRPS